MFRINSNEKKSQQDKTNVTYEQCTDVAFRFAAKSGALCAMAVTNPNYQEACNQSVELLNGLTAECKTYPKLSR